MTKRATLLILFLSTIFSFSNAQSIETLRLKISKVLQDKSATVGVAIKGSKQEEYIKYCIKNGSHTDCYLKKYESLIEAGQPLHQADDLTEFINLLKF